MKKIIILLIIIALISTGSYYYYQKVYLPSQKPTIEVEKNKATIKEYYIYGPHLNLEGNLKKINSRFKDIHLILWNTKNGKIKSYKMNYKKNVNNVNFNISDEINKGIYLDNIAKGNYELYIRLTYDNTNNSKSEQKKDHTYKYYSLDNTTSYDKITYYTNSKKNNKINFSKNDTTMLAKVTENNNDEVYDIVLDPSCGGIDKGAIGNETNESNITLEMATKVKEKLEKKNIKVKLTRTKDSLQDDEYFDEYNDGGRAVISHEVNAKYLFSFQANSSNYKTTSGFSIHTAANINYDFSAKLVENIIEKTKLKTSSNTSHRIDYGIYSHNFTEQEIEENMAYYDERGYTHYKITTKSNYLYMIRETGGIMTGAYVDESNPDKVGVNKYYNSNIGAEAYIIDLGYLTNQDDINVLTTKQEDYAEAIANTIIEELKY